MATRQSIVAQRLSVDAARKDPWFRQFPGIIPKLEAELRVAESELRNAEAIEQQRAIEKRQAELRGAGSSGAGGSGTGSSGTGSSGTGSSNTGRLQQPSSGTGSSGTGSRSQEQEPEQEPSTVMRVRGWHGSVEGIWHVDETGHAWFVGDEIEC